MLNLIVIILVFVFGVVKLVLVVGDKSFIYVFLLFMVMLFGMIKNVKFLFLLFLLIFVFMEKIKVVMKEIEVRVEGVLN